MKDSKLNTPATSPASHGSANFDPTLWRERVYVKDVKQECGEIWLRISAANAPRGTPPVACFAAGQILVIEIKHDPLGVHSPNAQALPQPADTGHERSH